MVTSILADIVAWLSRAALGALFYFFKARCHTKSNGSTCHTAATHCHCRQLTAVANSLQLHEAEISNDIRKPGTAAAQATVAAAAPEAWHGCWAWAAMAANAAAVTKAVPSTAQAIVSATDDVCSKNAFTPKPQAPIAQ